MMDVSVHIVAVCGLITGPDGRVLLIRHPRRGWEVPGGQVEEGESLYQAWQRETQEESGVLIQPGALTGIYHNMASPPRLIFTFLGAWISGEPATSNESLETEWVERGQVLARVTHPAVYARIKDMLEFSGHRVYRVYSTEPYRIHGEYRI